MPALHCDLAVAVKRIERELGLKLIPVLPARSRSSKHYRVESPLGVELFEICMFHSEERGWHVGGCGWTFAWQSMNEVIAPVKGGDE